MASGRKQSGKRGRNPKRTHTATECADELSISEETLKLYVSKGCPCDRGGPGKHNFYDPTEVASWMRESGLTGKPGRPASAGESTDLEAVRIRKETAMAVNWEYRNAQLEGELVNKAEYRQHWMTELQLIKNKCRGLGAAVAPSCVGMDAGEIQAIIDARIEQVFRELSAS